MEEPPLVWQLLGSTGQSGPSPGERRGFGRVDWGWARVGLVCVLGFLSSVVTMPAGVYMVTGTETGAVVVFVAQVALAYAILTGLVLGVGLRGVEGRWEALGFRPMDIRSLMGLLAVMAGVIVGVNLVGGLLVNLPHPRNIFLFGRGPDQVALTGLMVLVMAPLAEEIFFRGFLLQGLVKYLRFWPAAVVSSAVFAAAHTSLPLMPPIFILGLAFSWLFWRTGSIWAPIAAHATINGSSLLVLLLLG